ncbi:MAG: hypothetical protein ACJAXS_003165 [Colwellia sp.]
MINLIINVFDRNNVYSFFYNLDPQMKSLKVYSIKTKLIVSFSFLILLLSLIAWSGITGMSSINKLLEGAVNISAEKVKLSAHINQNVLAISRAEKNIILAQTQE